ncbi:MAG: hypothetical protein ABI390_10230, partial [Daejeonella sp.]
MNYFSGMKNAFRFFAFLDMGSIILLSPQIYSILTHLNELPGETVSRIKIILLLIVFLLLFISAAGLFLFKRFGAISYYIQFPIRLVVWVFSFGFLTFISEYFNNPLVFDWLFKLAIILEFFRLYYTIQ